MRAITYRIDTRHNGLSVSKFLKSQGYGIEVIKYLRENDCIIFNGKQATTAYIVHPGNTVTVLFKDEEWYAVQNPFIPAQIVYEDEDLVVFDKPTGIPAHQSPGHQEDTLANLFALLFPGMVFRAATRLDKNTSGLVLLTKNKFVASKIMTDRRYRPKKTYYAIAHGNVEEKLGKQGRIIAPIARESMETMRRCVRSDGQYARTDFKVLKSSEKMSFLEIDLVTGRTHQIRVHFSNEGFPLLGDEMYGGNTELIDRQALHCGHLSFIQPVTGKVVELSSPIPEDMRRIIDDR